MLGSEKHIFGDGGTLEQFLSTLGLRHIFQQESGILNKAKDKLNYKTWCSRISMACGFYNRIQIVKRSRTVENAQQAGNCWYEGTCGSLKKIL